MRNTFLITTAALLLSVVPAAAQDPSQLLQGLLSGNRGQDQAVRDAFERGYRQGRQDQAGEDRARFERRGPPPPREGYPQQNPNPGYPPPPPYNR